MIVGQLHSVHYYEFIAHSGDKLVDLFFVKSTVH